MITYKVVWVVLLDGAEVGEIRQLDNGKFCYFAQGRSDQRGEEFDTLKACQHSLEEV